MTSPVLITRREAQTAFPFRRIWRTALAECVLLLVICLGVFVAGNVLRFRPAGALRTVINAGLSVLPLILWYSISFRNEMRVREPRPRLLIVLLISMLGANAIGVPLLDRALTPDTWLTNAPGLTRILGYMLTAGLIQQFIQYASVRYSVWSDYIERRTDGVAYMMAAAVGYAVVLNVNYALTSNATSGALALRVIENTLLQYALSPILGYALWGFKFAPSLFGLPIAFTLAAGLTGLAINLRGSFILGSISPTSTGNNALQGIGFAVFLLLALFGTVNFLIRGADERNRQRTRSLSGVTER